MDSKYQHPSIQLYIMGLKPLVGSMQNMNKRIDLQNDEVETEGEISKEDDSGENSSGVNMINCGSEKAQ